jgi:hypothetical protein
MMIGGTKIQFGVHRLMKLLPKFGGELGASVQHDLLWYSVEAHSPGHVQFYQFSPRICHLDGYKMGNFGQLIYDGSNRVIPSLGMG